MKNATEIDKRAVSPGEAGLGILGAKAPHLPKEGKYGPRDHGTTA